MPSTFDLLLAVLAGAGWFLAFLALTVGTESSIALAALTKKLTAFLCVGLVVPKSPNLLSSIPGVILGSSRIISSP